MSEQFDKVLELAQKLKGPMVVYDKQGGKHLVILGIDEFAQYFDSNKKTLVEPQAPVNTNNSQAPEVKAESAMDESVFEPQVEVGESENVVESRIDVLPEEFAPLEPEVSSVEVEVPVKPKNPALTPSAQVSSQQWHRLGDVMRRVRPEITPQDTRQPVPYQAHEEPVLESDEPNFLEEPTP